MGNRYRYAMFYESLFSSNEIKLIFCPPLFTNNLYRNSWAKNNFIINKSMSLTTEVILHGYFGQFLSSR